MSGGLSRRRRGEARNPESGVYQQTVVGLEVRSPTSGARGSDASGESENVRNLIGLKSDKIHHFFSPPDGVQILRARRTEI